MLEYLGTAAGGHHPPARFQAQSIYPHILHQYIKTDQNSLKTYSSGPSTKHQ
jgi:hypothetical protein